MRDHRLHNFSLQLKPNSHDNMHKLKNTLSSGRTGKHIDARQAAAAFMFTTVC